MDLIFSIKKNPKKTIFAIFIITLIFLSIIFTKGLKYEFNEESFFPNNKIVRANEEILKEYTNYYIVPILVKSIDGNILNKEDLIDILVIEKRINENFSIAPFSIADLISNAFLGNKEANYENKINEIKNRSDSDIKDFIHLIIESHLIPVDLLSIFLTKDFNISNLKAEGTLIKVSLNGSLIFNEEKALNEEKRIDSITKIKSQHIRAATLGGMLVSNEIMKANRKSVGILLPLSFLLVIIILAIIYRNIFEIFVSLLILIISIIWTYGFASLLGYYLNPVTTAVPVLLVGTGIDYAIYLTLKIKENKKIKPVITAISLATITTAIAFLSNISSSISAIKQFGILASFGIISCFFITISLIPSFDEIKNFKRGNRKKIVINAFAFVVSKAKKNAGKTILILFLVTLIASYFSLNLRPTYSINDFLPKNMEIARDTSYLIKNFDALIGEEADILIKGNVSSPALLIQIKNTVDNMSDDDYVVKINGKASVISILSLMEIYAENNTFFSEYNKTFAKMYNNAMENGLPKKNTTWKSIKKLYDWIYKNGNGKYVLHKKGGYYDACVLRISTSTYKKEENIEKMYGEIKKDININASYIITGGIITGHIVMNSLQRSQVNSTILTIIFSFIILEIIFWKKYGSRTLAFVSMLPVIFVSIWILGTMGLFGISLNVITITVTSLSIGLGIDYSIHITHDFTDVGESSKVVRDIGAALLGSALTTIAAFSLLSFSLLPPLKTFGMLISIAILYNFIACLLLLPIFLDIWKKSKGKSKF